MRLGRLLVLAILILVGRTAASQEIQSQSKNSDHRDHAQQLTPQKDFGIGTDSGPVWTIPEDRADVCLTMHTIRVAREDSPEAGRVIGESTCTPGFRLKMKAIVENPASQK